MIDNSNTNVIAVAKDEFKSEEELWKKIGDTIHVLISFGYTCTVEEECGITIVIRFDHADPLICERLPIWLTPEEIEHVYAMRDGDDGDDE